MDFYEVLKTSHVSRFLRTGKWATRFSKELSVRIQSSNQRSFCASLEFVVVRYRENIAMWLPRLLNMVAFKELVFEVDESGLIKDKMAMFADALPKQQKMLMESGLLIIPFFRQQTSIHCWSPWNRVHLITLPRLGARWKNMLLAATSEGLGAVFHIPVGDEADKIKEIVKAPKVTSSLVCWLSDILQRVLSFLNKRKSVSKTGYMRMPGDNRWTRRDFQLLSIWLLNTLVWHKATGSKVGRKSAVFRGAQWKCAKVSVLKLWHYVFRMIGVEFLKCTTIKFIHYEH